MKTKIAIAFIALACGSQGLAQSRSIRDAATAYGARLTGKGDLADLNESRVNNRVVSRIDNRLRLRIERYHPENNDVATAFQTKQMDKSRVDPLLTYVPQESPMQTQD